MELEHRFEVPVGIDHAWASLLDMELVAACFPGATLTSADGEEYTGSVRVKLGPIQLTYKGSARIVEQDETAHRATIEASGNASRSSSTATMLVKATATQISADRTAVQMDTNLTITGRPAQFGRGVMAEVGNKIIGQFADCLSGKLAGGGERDGDGGAPAGADAAAAPAAAAGGSAGSAGAPSSTAPDDTTGAPVSVAAAGTTTGGAGGRPQPTSEPGPADASGAQGGTGSADASGAQGGTGPAGGPRHSAGYTRSPEPIDLLESAGAPVLKRLLPVLGGLVALWVLRRLFRGSKAKRLARKASRRAGKALELAKQAIEQDESSGE